MLVRIVRRMGVRRRRPWMGDDLGVHVGRRRVGVAVARRGGDRVWWRRWWRRNRQGSRPGAADGIPGRRAGGGGNRLRSCCVAGIEASGCYRRRRRRRVADVGREDRLGLDMRGQARASRAVFGTGGVIIVIILVQRALPGEIRGAFVLVRHALARVRRMQKLQQRQGGEFARKGRRGGDQAAGRSRSHTY